MDKLYTIYKTTNLINNKIYVGAHITTNLQDTYYGSSKLLKYDIKKYGKENFIKETLFIYDNKEEMLKMEEYIVNDDFVFRKDTYNQIRGGIYNMIFENTVVARDENENLFLLSKEDPRYINNNYNKGLTNYVNVIDKNGIGLQVKTTDPRYINGELIATSKNKVTVKDKDGKTFRVNINDSRLLSGELTGNQKNKVTVKDKTGKTFQVDKNDSRYISGELVSNMKNLVYVKDKMGKTLQVDKNDPRYISGELIFILKGKPRSEEAKRTIQKKMFIYDINMIFISEEYGLKEYCRKNKIGFGTLKKYLQNGKLNKKTKLYYFYNKQ